MFLSGDTQAQSHYARVPTISHPRNGFSIAKRHLTTIQFDKLFPMYVKYIYPGDTLAIQHHMMARLQTQVSDLFDDLYFDLHAWFVPMRLLQKNGPTTNLTRKILQHRTIQHFKVLDLT